MRRRRLRRAPFFLAALGAVTLAIALPHIADAAFVSPPTPADNATVAGYVPIRDNTRTQSATATRKACMNGAGTQTTAGSITKVEILDASNAVVTSAYVANDYSSISVTAANATWLSFGQPRGAYTIKTTYFNRAPTTTGAGTCVNICPSADLLSSTTFFGTTYPLCVPVASVDLAAGPIADPAAAGVTNRTRIINLQNTSTLTTPAGQSGVAGLGGVAHVTATLKDPFPGAAATSPTAAGFPATAPTQNNRPIAGKTVSFQIDGSPVATGVTDAAGVTSADVDTSALSVGGHTLSVSFGGGLNGVTDPQWVGSVVTSPVKIAGESTTTYTGDTSAFWDEDYTASARVEGATGGRPEPTDGGQVGFKLGSSTELLAPLVLDGANNAIASKTIHASEDPGAHNIASRFTGDALFNQSLDNDVFTITIRPTTLTYTGPTGAMYGDLVEFSADLKDLRRSAAFPTGTAGGQVIHFQLGNTGADAITDSTGHAKVTGQILEPAGVLSLVASYAGDVHYAPSQVTTPFTITKRYNFVDRLGDAKIDMNPGTHQFAYTSSTYSSGDVTEPLMFSIFLPKNFAFVLPTLPTVPADILNRMLGGAPGAPYPANNSPGATASIGTPLTGVVSKDPARNPIPIGGFTLGDLISKIQAGNYPTDLDTCQVLTGSTCERRLVVLTHRQNGFTIPAGVFDVKSGLFVALESDPRAAHLLYGFGTCLTDLIACIGYPVGLTGLPPLPALPIPTLPTIP